MPAPAGLPETLPRAGRGRSRLTRPPLRRAPTYRSRPGSSPPATASTRAPRSRSWSARGSVVRGELLPGGTEREWCEPDVLRRLRRASLARLRQEVEADRPARAGSLSRRAGRTSTPTGAAGAGPDRLREALVPLQGVALTPEGLGAGRPAAPPRRLQPGLARRALHERRAGLDRCRARWAETTARSPSTSARTSASPGRRPRTRSSTRPRARSTTPSASGSAGDPASGSTCSSSMASAEELHEALWDLAWSGEVTNDAFAPLRAPRLRAAQRCRARRPPLRRAAAPRPPGRHRALVAERSLFEGAPPAGPAAARPGGADAGAPRDRHPRDSARGGHPRRFRLALRRAPEPRVARDGAARLLRRGPREAPSSLCPGAVERLRSLPQADGSLLVLAATDPANPYGATLSVAQARGTAQAGPGPPGPT